MSPDGTQGWLNWAIWSPIEHRYLGYVQATVPSTGATSIAYVIFPGEWKKGVATQAVSLMINELTEKHGVRSLAATVDKRNRASIALLRRLGFSEVLCRECKWRADRGVGELIFRRELHEP